MTDRELLQEENAFIRGENRRLRAELLRAREDLELARERLAYAVSQVARMQKRVPPTQPQAVVPGEADDADATDLLERLMHAVRPPRVA